MQNTVNEAMMTTPGLIANNEAAIRSTHNFIEPYSEDCSGKTGGSFGKSSWPLQ